MNVYEINNYTIAAENKMSAYYKFLDEECNMEYTMDNGEELEEGESDGFEVKITRLTEAEINKRDVPCCDDGCDDCAEDDHTYFTLNELINKERKFPAVLTKSI